MGGPSSIDRLPEPARDAFDSELRKRGGTQKAAREAANQELEKMGSSERVSRSAANRYALRMREVGARLQQSRAIAEVWVKNLGSEPGGQVGHLLAEIVRTISFECAIQIGEEELDAESMPKILRTLRQLALTARDIEQSSAVSERRSRDLREQAAADMEAAIDREAADGAGGISAERLREIVREVYGAG